MQLADRRRPAIAQVAGLDPVAEQRPQLGRHARHGKQEAVGAQGVCDPGRHPGTIAQDHASLRHHRHFAIAGIELGSATKLCDPSTEHEVLHRGTGRLVVDERAVECSGQRLEGSVVRRGSQPAADKDPDQLGSGHVIADRGHNVRLHVPYHLDPLDGVAEGEQPAGQPVGVGVDGEAAEQLVTHGHDAGGRHG